MIDPVTSRYVEALFQLALREGALADVERDVRRIQAELERPGTAAFLFDARVSLETRRSKVEPLLLGAHRLTRNFVHLLFDKRRETVLKGLGRAFHQRSLRERGAVEGVVESARALGVQEIDALERALGARLSRTVSLSNEIHPDLIGGVRVIVDSRMLDNSILGRLGGLRKRMVEAPLPAARG